MVKKSAQNTVEPVVNPEHEQLIEVLKFTPRTYSIQIWGYGGETVMGTVDGKIYDYFRQRRLDVSDFAWNSDYADDNNIPEHMWPFSPGNYYDCDNIAHSNGASMEAGTLQILDEKGDTVLERTLGSIDGTDIELCYGEEAWVGQVGIGEVVFIGRTQEKGTFFEAEIELREPFDPEKLCITVDDIDGENFVSSVSYDGEDLDNNGGSTSGKGSDFGFFVNLGGGKFEKYATMDDIKYKLTDWFPGKVKPMLKGKYEVETAKGYTYHAMWSGEFWYNDWNDEKIKIKQWRGVAYDPDEHFLREELDQIVVAELQCEHCGWSGGASNTNNWDGQMCCPDCGEPVQSII